jgi:hypothetical protein
VPGQPPKATLTFADKLKQIITQLQGIMVSVEPEIADALKLTGPQRQAMRQILDETFMRQPIAAHLS